MLILMDIIKYKNGIITKELLKLIFMVEPFMVIGNGMILAEIVINTEVVVIFFNNKTLNIKYKYLLIILKRIYLYLFLND